jgi:adenylosuccinate lyase
MCDARRIDTILIDLCRDVWGYISLGYFKQAVKAGEVGSSTMPHKVNPIDFENAEGNFGIANALFEHFPPSCRSVAGSATSPTPPCCARSAPPSATPRSAGLARKGLGKLTVAPERLDGDLDAAWEVLAEPIQTVMRRYGLPQPYEQLKALTRGQGMTEATMREFIRGLALPEDARQRLLAMTPASYTGLAADLARAI